MNLPADAQIPYGSSNGIASIVNGKLVIHDDGNNSIISQGGSLMPYVEIVTDEQNFEVTFLELNGIQMNLTGETIPATAIFITKPSLEMFPRQTENLTVRYEPYNGEGTIIWSSSDTSVATVNRDTGVVTAVAPGNCIIRATCGNLSDTCSVTVKSNVVQTNNLEIQFVPTGNSWGADKGFFNVQYSINVKNLTQQPIRGWECDVVLPAGSRVNQAWVVTMTNTSGTTYHIVGPQHDLPAGATSSEAGGILIVPSVNYVPIPINIKP